MLRESVGVIIWGAVKALGRCRWIWDAVGMSFDWSDVIAIIAAVIAVVSIGAAVVANGHARESNAIAAAAHESAKAALSLQEKIDAREREFRDVRWKGGFATDQDDRLVFTVTNTGLTPACEVTVVYEHNGHRYVSELGELAPEEVGYARFETEMTGKSSIELMLFTDPPFLVHWSSPRGHAEAFSYSGTQLG